MASSASRRSSGSCIQTIGTAAEEDGLILAGDAAGLVDPFLGEGLYYALKSGEIAGEWVSQKADE